MLKVFDGEIIRTCGGGKSTVCTPPMFDLVNLSNLYVALSLSALALVHWRQIVRLQEIKAM